MSNKNWWKYLAMRVSVKPIGPAGIVVVRVQRHANIVTAPGRIPVYGAREPDAEK